MPLFDAIKQCSYSLIWENPNRTLTIFGNTKVPRVEFDGSPRNRDEEVNKGSGMSSGRARDRVGGSVGGKSGNSE